MDRIPFNRVIAMCLQNIWKRIISSKLVVFICLFFMLFIDFSAEPVKQQEKCAATQYQTHANEDVVGPEYYVVTPRDDFGQFQWKVHKQRQYSKAYEYCYYWYIRDFEIIILSKYSFYAVIFWLV